MESKLVLPQNYKSDLDKYYEKPTKAIGNLSLKQFFSLMYYTLDIEQPGLIFAPSWPNYLIPSTPEYKKTMENPTELFMDTITYDVTRQEPGSVGGNKQPFGGYKELIPRYREILRADDKSRTYHGQWFDNLVQFDLWTLTNFEAEDLALWFQRFMIVHRNFFKHMGLSEIHFWWRGRDDISSSIKNNLHLRTLVFFVRTEEISCEDDYNLQELQIKLEKLRK